MEAKPIHQDAEPARLKQHLARRIHELKGALPNQDPTQTALLLMLEDLEAQRQQVAQAAREWTAVFDAVRDPIFVHDREFRIVRANRAYAERAGMVVRELNGRLYWEVFPKDDGPLPGCACALREGHEEPREEELALDSGEQFVSRAFVVHDAEGRYVYSVHILEDVTGRMQAEHRRRLEELRLRASVQLGTMAGAEENAILDFVLEQAIAITDSRYAFIGWLNEDASVMSIHAWSKEVMAQCAVQDAPMEFPIDKAGVWAEPVRRREALVINDYSRPHPRKHGTPPGHVEIKRYLGVPVLEGDRVVLVAAVANKEKEYGDADIAALTGLMTDAWRVMQRNRAELSLQKVNRALKVLSACNALLIHAIEERRLLSDVCRLIVEIGDYRLAWVGYAVRDAQKTIRPVAQAGYEDGFLGSLPLTWGGEEVAGEFPRCPTGAAIQSGQPCTIQNIPAHRDDLPWCAQAEALQYAALIALPLHSETEVYGALTICAPEPNAFDQAEVKLLFELAEDLAFGIATLRTRLERDRLAASEQRTARQRQDALVQTIRAIARTVEKRDPYTSGHQQRVAELSTAIARELNLPEERIEGIRLGATIHDIGKVYIPAEILNRPGKLSDAEFEIIKSHAQVGWDIVKDIEFPWPVAEMILQHHERLDGSGYPHGLKGEAITLEARILAVADTVEAMASHRPYRPGLGVDAALEEIAKNRGKLYDAEVVDACLRLFREKGFGFE